MPGPKAYCPRGTLDKRIATVKDEADGFLTRAAGEQRDRRNALSEAASGYGQQMTPTPADISLSGAQGALVT